MVLILSENLESLIDRLIEEMSTLGAMETRTILVPNSQIKQWLLLAIAKKKGIAMGIKVLEIGPFFAPRKNSLETFCLLYSALSKSQEPEIISYLDGKKKRLLGFTAQLNALFAKYSQYELPEGQTWQHDLFKKLFVPEDLHISEPLVCFGIDYFPPRYWEALQRAPSLSIYLFSPCREFWEDLCTDRERKKIWKKAPKKLREELDAYLREGPRHLANWGKLGRVALRSFEDLESEEIYTSIESSSLLKRVQCDLLNFQETKAPTIDDSIQILLTGSSRLREIEVLKEEILRLEIPYHEISVLAPDIEPYVSFIQYVFDEIPYRISEVDIAAQSSFRQGLLRLLALGSGRWDVEELFTLFETPSFYRKKKWDMEILEFFRDWIRSVGVKWGFNEGHRKRVLQDILGEKDFVDEGSWEKGLENLLEAIIYLKPMQVNCDLFEELISTLYGLQELDLKGDKTLLNWAHALEKAADAYLIADPNDEADMAVENHFRHLLLELKKCSHDDLYPFEVIQHFLTVPCRAQLNGSKLHSIRFSSIAEGAQIPSKALFLIGMDEMSFPKLDTPSSLNLLREKMPKSADFDRYLFLQAIFSAKEFLRVSYGHLSAEEGKPVNPSLLVQELMAITSPSISRVCPQPQVREAKKHFPFPSFTKIDMPMGEMVLSIRELRQLTRHPWKFFLQKAHQIYLDEELPENFALQRGKQISEFFEKGIYSGGVLPRPFQKAMETEVQRTVAERHAQLQEWQLEPLSLLLKENCEKEHREGNTLIAPALELHWEKFKVRLVGEIKFVTEKGFLSTQEDTIAGTLKIWPEALASAIAMDTSEIWMLRDGKTRSVVTAQESLKRFIEYYFHALKAPSPLLPEWADAFLRKEASDLAKKMDRESPFEDPVMDWIFARAQIATPEILFETWGPFLKEVFQDLAKLYPMRGSHAKV